eukprot:Gb_08827 [translate_table: standard]
MCREKKLERLGVKAYSWDGFLLLGTKRNIELSAPKKSDISTIMYTSGTTGEPKGVLITHESIVTFVTGIKGCLNRILAWGRQAFGRGYWRMCMGSINIPNMWRKCRDSSDTEDRKPYSETLRRISIVDALPNASLSNPLHRLAAEQTPKLQLTRGQGIDFSNSFAPVLTDAVTPTLNRAPVEARDFTQAGNPLQSMSLTRHFLPSKNLDLHLAHSMHGISISSIGMEAERHSNKLVSRAPIAILAMSAQSRVANSFTRSRMSALHSNSTT